MMDFNERVIPGVTANFQFKESLARYEFALGCLRKGIKVLDVGCGTGYGSDLLSRKFKVIALDKDREAISFAKKHYPNGARFIVGDATKLPFKDEEFDAVCSFEVIEHIQNIGKMLSEVRRVLKNEGRFILSTPKKSEEGCVRSPYHIREYNESGLMDLLEKYFREVDILGQIKSTRASDAFCDFLDSQRAREFLVKKDFLGLRKIFPRSLRERVWRHIGNFFGRKSQENLSTSDFPIKAGDLDKAEFLIAVCVK